MLVLNCPGAKLSDAKLSIFFSCCQIVCFYYLVAELSGGQLFWYEVELCKIVLPPHGMVGQFSTQCFQISVDKGGGNVCEM